MGNASDMTANRFQLSEEPAFADILHPLSEDAFFAEYYDRKPLHLEGDPRKFAAVMSWDGLTSILNMTAIWSSASLQLVHDKEIVPPPRYCRSTKNRDGQPVLQPDAGKVMRLLQRGASLVANDIDTLTPALRGVAGVLEGALCGKAQANLYCSWEEHQAFGTHFDTHDVYAMHIAGEKLWRIYETRAEAPIAHPQFKSYGQEWHDENRGKVAQEILMRPGDLLYLPRGQYHDAIATSDGTIHIAFGVTHVIGMDVIDLFAGMAVNDLLFRRNMPRRSDDETEAGAWLAALGDRMAAYARTPDAVAAIRKYQQEFGYPRAGFDLPVAPPAIPHRLTAKDLKVEQRSGAWILTGPKGSVPIPAGLEGPVSWIVSQTVFTHDDLVGAFPKIAQSELETLLEDLAGMKVVARGV
jgi:ribosomal protein L16 Arg81 hydroxylase